mmetsp:Transcript_41471/g.137422  ORF Transcript_41471/g.137422 Transcript_41471/m.137422 type:complete len:241 (+) Transcript_41471:2317-3039(+)
MSCSVQRGPLSWRNHVPPLAAPPAHPTRQQQLPPGFEWCPTGDFLPPQVAEAPPPSSPSLPLSHHCGRGSALPPWRTGLSNTPSAASQSSLLRPPLLWARLWPWSRRAAERTRRSCHPLTKRLTPRRSRRPWHPSVCAPQGDPGVSAHAGAPRWRVRGGGLLRRADPHRRSRAQKGRRRRERQLPAQRGACRGAASVRLAQAAGLGPVPMAADESRAIEVASPQHAALPIHPTRRRECTG